MSTLNRGILIAYRSRWTMEHLLQHGDQKRTPFAALLRRLDLQKDHAADRYEELRRKLIKFFEWSSCFPSEDLADETLDRLGRILLDRPVLDLEPFLWGVAKKIRQESHKHSERIVAITDLPDRGTFLKDKVDVESEIHATEQGEVRSRCLRLCLNNMSQESRGVFLKYQGLHNKQQREQLASELGLTIGALRVRINRIKKQLQGSVQQCLASSASETAAAQLDGHGSRENRLVAVAAVQETRRLKQCGDVKARILLNHVAPWIRTGHRRKHFPGRKNSASAASRRGDVTQIFACGPRLCNAEIPGISCRLTAGKRFVLWRTSSKSHLTSFGL